MTTKSTECSLFSNLRKPSVNRKDLRALTLVGPPRDMPELDPLGVVHLDKWLFIIGAGKSAGSANHRYKAYYYDICMQVSLSAI